MAEYVCDFGDKSSAFVGLAMAEATAHGAELRERIVRCRDCKHLDDSEYTRWDSALAENYGEPPLFCELLSFNEWRMDGDRRVAETSFAEVEPDGYCAWGERRA